MASAQAKPGAKRPREDVGAEDRAYHHPSDQSGMNPAGASPHAPPLSRPSFDLTGGRYIVTGGSQGLGLEIARQLRACGAHKIAIMARTVSKGKAAAKALSDPEGGRFGCEAVFVRVDLQDPAALAAAAAEAIAALGGRVDGLINAAGCTDRGNLSNTTAEMFDKQFQINTRAPLLLTQAVASHQIAEKRRGCSVVNVSSIAAKGGAPFIMSYSASKAALNALTLNNAGELQPHGIRVNAVNMGWTYTENENALMRAKAGNDWLAQADARLPLKRLLRPVDVACTVLFLLSPASAMMTGNVLDLHPENLAASGLLSLQADDDMVTKDQ